MNGMKTAALFAVMMVALVPCVASEASDAAGQWWGTTHYIGLEAGSNITYDVVSVPGGEEIRKITVTGDLGNCFTVTGNKVYASVPRGIAAGDYANRLTAQTDNGSYWVDLVLHVTASAHGGEYGANAPIIGDVEVSPINSDGSVMMVTVNTSNTDNISFSFDDGIFSEVSVSGGKVFTTHNYSGSGVYAISVSASNAYGTAQKVVVYSTGYSDEVSPEETSDDSTPWLLYILIVAAIAMAMIALAHVAFYPLAIAAAIVLGLSAGVDYLWFM